METIPFYQSKTFWVAALTTIVPMIPAAAPVLALHPQMITSLVGAAFLALRWITNQGITIRRNPPTPPAKDVAQLKSDISPGKGSSSIPGP